MFFIIYAHPDKNSFNHAVLETIKATLTSQKKDFRVLDLYEINYNPVLSFEELKGKNSDQTLDLQKTIKESEGLIFIFPVWWFRAPAILEGFCDKTFTVGFSYRFKKIIGMYGIPVRLLKDKTVTAFITHGAPALPVKILYVNAVKYRFLLGFLSFNFKLTKCSIYQLWAIPFVSPEKRKSYLRKVERVISKLAR